LNGEDGVAVDTYIQDKWSLGAQCYYALLTLLKINLKTTFLLNYQEIFITTPKDMGFNRFKGTRSETQALNSKLTKSALANWRRL
jgi:hypothetical protein